MEAKHLLKLTVSMICEPSHASVMDYYHFRDIIMDSKVKHLLFYKKYLSIKLHTDLQHFRMLSSKNIFSSNTKIMELI